MWYLLPKSSLDAGLVHMNTDPEVMPMAEVGLKYGIVTMCTEANRMEDGGDDGMEAGVAGDGDEDDTDDDVWEVEDGEKDETEIDDSELGGYEGVSDGENKELTDVRENRGSTFELVLDKDGPDCAARFKRLYGLEKAVKTLLPHVEHRVCARHVYANWKKKHNGVALKHLFWRFCHAYYDVEQARKIMKKGMDEHVVQEAMNEHVDIPSTGEQASPSELEAKQPTIEQQIFKELNVAQKGVGVLYGDSGFYGSR
ncbi:hypothetical protein CRG98_029582 [Punica granatum]|uniref:Transposase MuDR plant domain-containing protein n=1 Tax=Punica granatum TaxID=22663 RepID=A0A2I0J1C8_PUNGR|nr:hypothetical protein CRG98_029582 [Punica granatum]